jgi:pimeloyl-ACP methyl ester carboxylesterase
MHLPVSIIFGRSDGILNPRDQGEALAAKLPGAQLTLVEGGHMLPITVPGLIAQFIKDADPRFRDAGARRAV